MFDLYVRVVLAFALGFMLMGLLAWSVMSIVMYGRQAWCGKDPMKQGDWFWLGMNLFFTLPIALWNCSNFYEFVLKS